jgi:hypothetical protein
MCRWGLGLPVLVEGVLWRRRRILASRRGFLRPLGVCTCTWLLRRLLFPFLRLSNLCIRSLLRPCIGCSVQSRCYRNCLRFYVILELLRLLLLRCHPRFIDHIDISKWLLVCHLRLVHRVLSIVAKSCSLEGIPLPL